MTINIEVATLYSILKDLPHDADGWVSMKEFLSRASKFYLCTPLTIRNFIVRHSGFRIKHGLIQPMLDTIVTQVKDDGDYVKWRAQRDAILTECAEFLKLQTPSPFLDNTLVKVSSAREELSRYSDNQLTLLLMELQNEYKFAPKSLLALPVEQTVTGSDKNE